MDDLAAHVNGRAEGLKGDLDDIDGAHHAGAETARLEQQHPLLAGGSPWGTVTGNGIEDSCSHIFKYTNRRDETIGKKCPGLRCLSRRSRGRTEACPRGPTGSKGEASEVETSRNAAHLGSGVSDDTPTRPPSRSSRLDVRVNYVSLGSLRLSADWRLRQPSSVPCSPDPVNPWPWRHGRACPTR